MAVAVGDRGDHLDDIDIDFFRVAQRLRPNRADDAPAFEELGDHADLVRGNRAARFPRAFIRRGLRGTDLTPVHVEQQASGGGERRHRGAERRRAADIGVCGGGENLERRRSSGRRVLRARMPSGRADHKQQTRQPENVAGPHCFSGTSGSNGPSAVAAAT